MLSGIDRDGIHHTLLATDFNLDGEPVNTNVTIPRYTTLSESE